jgi:hypothetical protein
MESQEHLKLLGHQLAHELTAHDKIRAFVGSHPVLIGNYAEASIRDFISRMVTPLKVSTGTILYEKNIGNPPQLDAIVWSPILTPAIFENGNFAIVPRGNAHGFLEIKSTSYSDAGEDIAKKLAYEDELIRRRESRSCSRESHRLKWGSDDSKRMGAELHRMETIEPPPTPFRRNYPF